MTVSRRNFLAWAGAGVVAAAIDVGGLVSPVLSTPAFAATTVDPGRGLFGGLTTLDQTVVRPNANTAVNHGYVKLAHGPGEPHLVVDDLAPFSPGFPNGSGDRLHAHVFRRPTIRLLALAQMTDLHIVDDQSPGRVEFTDRLADGGSGYSTDSAYRPNEMLTTQVVDAMCQAIQNVGRGPITNLPLSHTLVTGDVVDNVQLNETRWYIDLLDGGHTITPDSGQAGVEESVSYLFGSNNAHEIHYWGPEFQTSDNYKAAGFGYIPGLLAAARRPFISTGLGPMKWYAALGNHDGEIQGNYPVHPTGLVACIVNDISGTATDSKKAYTSTTLSTFPKDPTADDINTFINNLLYIPVSPDNQRKMLGKNEFALEHYTTTGFPRGHGLTDGTAFTTYYDVPLAASDLIRFIALDTVNTDGNAGGRMNKNQLTWLEDRLKENSRRYLDVTGGFNWVTHDVVDRLYVLFFHHAIDTINNDTGDLANPSNYGYETDLLNLLSRFPNVVLAVNGHTHRNRIIPIIFANHPSPNDSFGFWEISTAAHVDWPVQSRIIELALGGDQFPLNDNPTVGNGILSIYTSVVDIDAPLDYAGDLSSPKALASLARELAANDPTERGSTRHGEPGHRNTQLLVKMPFTSNIPMQDVWGSSVALGRNADGRLEIFEADSLGHILHRWQPVAGSDTWNTAQLFDSTAESLTAVATEIHQDGRLAMFGVNSLGEVWYRTEILNNGWAPYTYFDSMNGRAITAARNSDGRLEIFVATTGGAVAQRYQTAANSSVWSGWNLEFGPYSGVSGERMVDVAAHHNQDGRVELFAVTRNGTLFHRWQLSGGGWSDWTEMTLPSFDLKSANQSSDITYARFDKIAVTDSNNGRLVLFATDHDRRVWWRRQNSINVTADSDWGSWIPFDGRMTQITACRATVGTAAGTIQLMGADHLGAIWSRRQTAADATTWTAWSLFQPNDAVRSDTMISPNNASRPIAKVPTLVSLTLEIAQKLLGIVNLALTTTHALNAAYPAGTVYSQNIGSGQVIPQGTAVELGVSDGGVLVPNIMGKDRTTALTMLQNAGLASLQQADVIVFDSIDAGKVVWCQPGAGVTVAVGSTVQFALGLWSGANR